EAALIFLSPDGLCSDGTFAHALNLAAEGKRAVMLTGIRAVKETFLPWYVQNAYSESDHAAPISSRDLVAAGLAHLHPQNQWLVWGSPVFSRWASSLLFPVDGAGFVARCFHLHPLLVDPRVRTALPSSTID